MIKVTLEGKKGKAISLNPHQIEYIESEGSTIIVMLSGKRLRVNENHDEILERIVEYRCRIGGFKNEE